MVSSIGSGFDPMQMIDQFKQMMKSADTDGTKGLSKDELSTLSSKIDSGNKQQSQFLDKLQENFQKIDKDGDGSLSENEISSVMKKPGGGGRPGGVKPKGNSTEESDDSSEESVEYVDDDENVSPITIDKNGNTVFKTVIKLGSGKGSSESTPTLNPSLLNSSSNFDVKEDGMRNFVSKSYNFNSSSTQNQSTLDIAV